MNTRDSSSRCSLYQKAPSTTWAKLTVLACVILCLSTSVAGAQIGVYWIARYSGPVGTDWPQDLVVDELGNAYVTGLSQGVGLADDFLTIKYSPSGDTLWTRRYKDPGSGGYHANALAVDAAGSVYVTGSSDVPGDAGGVLTIKYAATGDFLWARSWNGGTDGGDAAYAIAMDDSGNVYVTGTGGWPGQNWWGADYVTIKYSPDGDEIWMRHYNGTGNSGDWAYAVAADRNGNAFVTGISHVTYSITEFATVKYTSAGDEEWVRHYQGTSTGDNWSTLLAVDDSGNVYVSGLSSGDGTGWDFATIKYSPSGDTLWVRRYNGPANGDDAPSALALDSAGNVYVAGGNGDYVALKYSAEGDLEWLQTYDGTANSVDGAFAMAVDGRGNCFVTGETRGAGTSRDCTTVKYSATGTKQWVRHYQGPEALSDQAGTTIRVDERGDVYVSTFTRGVDGFAPAPDYITVKYWNGNGDVDCDACTDLTDVVALGNHLDGVYPLLDSCAQVEADVNSDGTIGEADYDLLYDGVAGGE